MQIDSNLVKTVISDIGNGYKNGALLAAHLIGGVVIGIAVDLLANKKTEPGVQKEFSIKMNSHTLFDLTSFKSMVVKTIAVAAAATASFYIAPHCRFVKFSAGRFSYLSMLFTAAVLGIKRRQQGRVRTRMGSEVRKPCVIPFGLAVLGIAGMNSGPFGYHSLIPCAAIGAAFGSVSDKKMNS